MRFHHRLFLLLLAVSWSIVALFTVFQYQREKSYKAEKLNTRLQTLNRCVLSSGAQPADMAAAADSLLRSTSPRNSGPLRLTVISTDGTVVYDNTCDPRREANHRTRPEVAQALRTGEGYTIDRHSQTDDREYFYSATRGHDCIVRTALPYSATLNETLAADKELIITMLLIAAAISAAGYVATRHLGQTITRLNDFAARAERGERIMGDESFPHDELGSISEHIVRLYARLQQTTIDRDREHTQALHQEQEKIRIKKQLTNNINHELKTPVAAVSVCLETLIAHPDLPDDKRLHFLQRAYGQTERLGSLLADVATLTRIDDGGRQIDFRTVSLRQACQTAIDDERLRPEAAAFAIANRLPEDLTAEGNEELIVSLFRNLLNNAISYSGGSTIDIAYSGGVLTFADNGCGVAPEHLPHLFERFYRADSGRSRKHGGTGLGLAIVRNTATLHHWPITVSNAPAGGLVFKMKIRSQA